MTIIGIGLMSGTSLDGVDAALVEVRGERDVRLRAFVTTPYEPGERDALLGALRQAGARELALVHRQLGRRFAAAAMRVAEAAGVALETVDFVASHGQTIWHEPGEVSWQLGCAATIAEVVGTPIVSDFRARDVAAGGEGAPLGPMADVMLFAAERGPRALLNIGGMANVTWVARAGDTDGVIAFDTGPGVAVIDAVTRRLRPDLPFDRDGALAAAGSAVTGVVEELLGEPYFDRPPPKSTGRERFGVAYADALIDAVRGARPDAADEDCIATAAALTIQSIARQCRQWVPNIGDGDLIVSGGGARNPVLRSGLAAAMAPVSVRSFDDVYFDGDAKEAVAFAYLGWRTLEGLPGNVPSATGAAGPRVLGTVTYP